MKQFENEKVKEAYYYHASLAKEELLKRKKEFERMASSREVRTNKDDSVDIGLLALGNLEKMGFDKEKFSTIVLANLVEDIFHERSNFDSSEYFDLSAPNNLHYKYMLERYPIGDPEFFRGIVAWGIGTSECEAKNVNDVVYGVTNEIIKIVDKKAKLLKLDRKNDVK